MIDYKLFDSILESCARDSAEFKIAQTYERTITKDDFVILTPEYDELPGKFEKYQIELYLKAHRNAIALSVPLCAPFLSRLRKTSEEDPHFIVSDLRIVQYEDELYYLEQLGIYHSRDIAASGGEIGLPVLQLIRICKYKDVERKIVRQLQNYLSFLRRISSTLDMSLCNHNADIVFRDTSRPYFTAVLSSLNYYVKNTGVWCINLNLGTDDITIYDGGIDKDNLHKYFEYLTVFEYEDRLREMFNRLEDPEMGVSMLQIGYNTVEGSVLGKFKAIVLNSIDSSYHHLNFGKFREENDQ